MKVQREKMSPLETACSVFLENTCVVLSRMLVEVSMLRVSLMRSQRDMRNVLLDNGGKARLAIKWQRT